MFKNLFNSRLGQILTRLADLILLQLAFLVTSLPIVTIGAGISALYSVSKKLKADSVSYTLPAYWAAFKENFKTSTCPKQVDYKITRIGKGTADIQWTRVKGATSYAVIYKPSMNDEWRKLCE